MASSGLDSSTSSGSSSRSSSRSSSSASGSSSSLMHRSKGTKHRISDRSRRKSKAKRQPDQRRRKSSIALRMLVIAGFVQMIVTIVIVVKMDTRSPMPQQRDVLQVATSHRHLRALNNDDVHWRDSPDKPEVAIQDGSSSHHEADAPPSSGLPLHQQQQQLEPNHTPQIVKLHANALGDAFAASASYLPKESSSHQRFDHWKPTECPSTASTSTLASTSPQTPSGQHRLAIIIPFRESQNDLRSQGRGRDENLQEWLLQMRRILPQSVLDNSHVFVVEQTQEDIFNRGMLLNAGFDFVFEREFACRFDYLVIQDVDQLPNEQTASFIYDFRPIPTRLISEARRKDTPTSDGVRHLLNPFDTSGAFMMTPAHFRGVNGYSNMLPGWGVSNVNMYYRIRKTYSDPAVIKNAHFTELFHPRVHGLDVGRLFQQKQRLAANEFATGLSTLDYELHQVKHHQVDGWDMTRLLVRTQSPAEQHLPAPQRVIAPQATEAETSHGAKTAPIHRDRSCQLLFGKAAVRPSRDNQCIQHSLLKWRACRLEDLTIHPDMIDGPVGGEDIESAVLAEQQHALARSAPLASADLEYRPGSVSVPQAVPAATQRDHSFQGPSRAFMDSIQVREDPANGISSAAAPSSSSVEPFHPDEVVHLLVDRGDYANPCMSISKMYNAFVAIEKFGIERHRIVFLDGHAKSGLDELWQTSFGDVVYIKQLAAQDGNDNGSVHIPRAVMVSTVSTIGDEGMRNYEWGSACQQDSTLHRFRDFILRKFGIARSATDQKRVTMLVRRDYIAHPTSDGITDRKLANEAEDAEYIQDLYPHHTVNVVAFEDMPIHEQIRIMSQTDVLVAIHGAGNILSMFLPDHAAFTEYFPPTFYNRKRFQFISESLGIHYTASKATLVSHDAQTRKMTVQIRPRY